jgi:hypothetical protein
LVQLWQKDRPPGLQELLWYRLPIETDARNWRMATFTAVVSGRRPQHHVSAVSEGTNPVDIVIRNEGEADEKLNIRLQVNSDELVLDSDALTGWRVDVGGSGSVFSTNRDEPIQLRPGETRGVGWLRFARPPKLNFELVKS